MTAVIYTLLICTLISVIESLRHATKSATCKRDYVVSKTARNSFSGDFSAVGEHSDPRSLSIQSILSAERSQITFQSWKAVFSQCMKRVALSGVVAIMVLADPAIPTPPDQRNDIGAAPSTATSNSNHKPNQKRSETGVVSETAKIQNHLVHYGVYCGPGPDDSFGGPPPVDAIDRVCQGHDQRYKLCLEDFDFSVAGTTSTSNSMRAPRFIHQIMAIRGKLPRPISHLLTDMFPAYAACVHNADTYFVQGLHSVIDSDNVPAWWDAPSKAPLGAEGVEGYSQACALGLPSTSVPPLPVLNFTPLSFVPPAQAATGFEKSSRRPTGTGATTINSPTTSSAASTNSNGICLVPSKSLFLSGAIDLFQSALEADKD